MVQNDAMGDWYGVVLVLVFTIGDFVSRMTPSQWVCVRPMTLMVSMIARGIFIPLTFFCIQRFSHPIVISSLLLLLGLSNGYAVSGVRDEGGVGISHFVVLRLDMAPLSQRRLRFLGEIS